MHVRFITRFFTSLDVELNGDAYSHLHICTAMLQLWRMLTLTNIEVCFSRGRMALKGTKGVLGYQAILENQD